MDKEMLIRDIFAREILDSRGNPTIYQLLDNKLVERWTEYVEKEWSGQLKM